jgi:predicted component of type VI protein secretion system
MKNEFEEAMQNVLDYGLKAIDNLTAEDLAKLQMMFEGIK